MTTGGATGTMTGAVMIAAMAAVMIADATIAGTTGTPDVLHLLPTRPPASGVALGCAAHLQVGAVYRVCHRYPGPRMRR